MVKEINTIPLLESKIKNLTSILSYKLNNKDKVHQLDRLSNLVEELHVLKGKRKRWLYCNTIFMLYNYVIEFNVKHKYFNFML